MAKHQKPPEKKPEQPAMKDGDRVQMQTAVGPITLIADSSVPPGEFRLQPQEPALTTQAQSEDESPTEAAQPNAEHAQEQLLAALQNLLAPERQEGEGPLKALERIISEARIGRADDLTIRSVNNMLEFEAGMPVKKHGDEDERVRELAQRHKQAVRERDELAAQLQPAHNAFGPLANARGFVVSHVKGSGKDYDEGGKYRVLRVAVQDGQVSMSEVADIVGGELTSELPFGLVRNHLERDGEEFIAPKAHRS